jgi:hypothetical protein
VRNDGAMSKDEKGSQTVYEMTIPENGAEGNSQEVRGAPSVMETCNELSGVSMLGL